MMSDLFHGLPGADLIREGLADLHAGRRTAAACLAAIGWPKMRRARLVQRMPPHTPADAELELYRILRRDGGDAYSRYNALLRQLASFEHALDRRRRSLEEFSAPEAPSS